MQNATNEKGLIPKDDQERKDAPMFRGLLAYFPMALFAVARHSLESDRKHNPDNPYAPQWSRGKSADHKDCIIRHLVDTQDPSEEEYHLRAIAWRGLAMLQEYYEEQGHTPGNSSTWEKESCVL